MRLWHKDLLPYIDQQRFVSQWRELKAIQGTFDKHGKLNHSTINPIMGFSKEHFVTYYRYLYLLSVQRRYRFDITLLARYNGRDNVTIDELYDGWHNDEYLNECLSILEHKRSLGEMSRWDWEDLMEHFYKDETGIYKKR